MTLQLYQTFQLTMIAHMKHTIFQLIKNDHIRNSQGGKLSRSIYERAGVNTRQVTIPHCNLEILAKHTDWVLFVQHHIDLYGMYPTKMFNLIHQDGKFTNPRDMAQNRILSEIFGFNSRNAQVFIEIVKIIHPDLDILSGGANDRRIPHSKARNTERRQDPGVTQNQGT